jgi:hypothetical protein
MTRAALDQQDSWERRDGAAEEVAQVTIVAKLKYLDNYLDLSA